MRQLRNVMRYACAVCDGARVTRRDLPADVAAQLGADPGSVLPDDERSRIVAALSAHRWRPDAAAQALGMSRATLYRRIAKYRIVAPHRV